MTGELLHAFSELLVALAGVAIGLCVLIVGVYWRVWRTVRDGARLLPAHIIGIGTSYGMLALLAVLRMGDVPPPTGHEGWWVYPWATLAFAIGDVALVLILWFVARRGPRHRPHGKEKL